MLPDWLKEWVPRFEAEVMRAGLDDDPAHDLGHIQRVVHLALHLAKVEGADNAIVLPAAYLHDIVNIPKNDPRRSQASRLAGEEAFMFLQAQGYPRQYLDSVRDAIESHSYSAGIAPRTIEAEVVQDADRLDSLGAIGVVRCFTVGTEIQRRFYDLKDPFARARELDEMKFTLDHFFVKLLKLADTLRTRSGRLEGYRRLEFMKEFLRHFEREIHVQHEV